MSYVYHGGEIDVHEVSLGVSIGTGGVCAYFYHSSLVGYVLCIKKSLCYSILFYCHYYYYYLVTLPSLEWPIGGFNS